MNTAFNVARQLTDLLEAWGDADRAAVARLLHQRLGAPESFVTLVGETGTGKSTLANSLIGRHFLPTAAQPTTAAVTELVFGQFERDRYLAIYRDATQEELNAERFRALAQNPPEDLLRLHARTCPADARHEGLHVFDTPGYNSILLEHEEVLRQFLPQSDVVVFLVGYRTGLGQSDQDLLEVVRTALEDDPEAPVLLVVNRVPTQVGIENARVQEIVANACDSLWSEPELFLVKTASEGVALIDGAVEPESASPDASTLWNRVVAIVAAPERQRSVEQKLVSALRKLIDDAVKALERQDLILTAGQEEVEMIEEQLRSLQVARARSLDAVKEATERMRSQLPASLERLAAGIKSKLKEDIEGSDKWLGLNECVAWLSAHAMPFEVRQAARSIEESISVELQELDRRLGEIANTAVQEIEHSIHIRSEAGRRFAENLARVVAQRLGGAGINALFRAFGGVGGAAAGAGNLVKMLVSRMGNLLGKTFSRQVYNWIGRTFTKRALARLNVAISVLIEVLAFVREAHRWQGALVAKVHEAVNGWAQDVRKNLLEVHLPKMHDSNVRSVGAIYDLLLEECQKALGRRAEEVRPRTVRYSAASRRTRSPG